MTHESETWRPGHWTAAKIEKFVRDVDRATLKALSEITRPHEARILMAEILAERGSRRSREMLAALDGQPVHLGTRPGRRRDKTENPSGKRLPKQLAFNFTDDHP